MSKTAFILAGGKGSRLGGVDKGFLEYQGKFFIEHILNQLNSFAQIIISTNNQKKYEQFNYPIISDEHLNIGPIEAIYQGLKHSRTDWNFIISVDQPLFSKMIPLYLEEFFCSDYDAIIPKDHNEIYYPLCGYYHKNCEKTILSQINAEKYSIHNMLKLLRVKIVDISQTIFYSQKMMINVNTFEDKQLLPLIVAISGSQNSGKTTLICKLIPEFEKHKKTVATIKHTKHSYSFDEEGKDTFLHRKAGAKATAIFSPDSFMINQETPTPDFLKIFEQYDVILLEGFKDSLYPKIEVFKDENSHVSLKNVIAQVGGEKTSCPHFTSNQTQEIVNFLLYQK
ncbi:MAG: molybdopterin-guanine dinucleotide biosynthesis protein B [Brevinema sp.]